MQTLREQGKSIIFITHKLKEVLHIADRIMVLRGGRVVGEADPKTATQQQLASMMVGREVILTVEKEAPRSPKTSFWICRNSRRPATWASRRCAGSPSRCAPARSSAWPACRATARPNWSR
jgi:ABC-type sugar transport system ATPase subunit